MTRLSLALCSLVTFFSVHGILGGVLGAPIDKSAWGCRTSIIVSLDPRLPEHVYNSHFESASIMDLDILRHFNIGSEYRGYLASVPCSALEFLLEELPRAEAVLLVEPDATGHVDELETSAPWGLGRISHRRIESDRQYQQYIYNKDGGSNVKVFLLDSGVYSEHEEFQQEQKGWLPPLPRARLVKNFVTSEWGDEDYAGHGTHCAGTIGGTNFGVAKNVEIDVVKVCDGAGECQMSNVIAGLEYAVGEFLHSPAQASKGSLISMSLGLPSNKSVSLAMAAKAAVRSGILVVASAGNDNTDACTHTPASVPEVLTVGATTVDDSRAPFSNYGSCVDIFAPGNSILSASNQGPRRTRLMSGTSMSTPHVSGLVAYYLSLADDGVFTTPEFIKGFVMSRATPEVVKDAKDSRNLLAFNG